MSEFGKPFEGPEIMPTIKQKDYDYQIEYDIEIKPISRRAKKEQKEWQKFLQRYPQLVGLSGMPLALECQKITNRAMAKQIMESECVKLAYTKKVGDDIDRALKLCGFRRLEEPPTSERNEGCA